MLENGRDLLQAFPSFQVPLRFRNRDVRLTPLEKLLASLLLVGGFTAARILLIHLIRIRSQFISQEQRRWINLAKSGVLVLIVVGLLAIWSAELRQFVLSRSSAPPKRRSRPNNGFRAIS